MNGFFCENKAFEWAMGSSRKVILMKDFDKPTFREGPFIKISNNIVSIPFM